MPNENIYSPWYQLNKYDQSAEYHTSITKTAP